MNYEDLDFFQPERDREALRLRNTIQKIVPAILLIVILVYFIILSIQQNILENELENITSQNEITQEEIKDAESEIHDLKANIKSIEDLTTVLESSDVLGVTPISEITEHQLIAIKYSTPEEAFYTNIDIANEKLKLEGYAKNTQVVAKLVYNLGLTEYYENVYIDNITISENDENSYEFTIYANIKE